MIYYVVIGIYLIGLLLIGFSKSDSIKNQEDFAVAGRSLTPWILVGTMAATWMGTGSVLGNAGKAFEIGAAGFLLPIGGMLGVLVLTKVAGKARASGKLTVPEIIGSRFGDTAMILSVIALLTAIDSSVKYTTRLTISDEKAASGGNKSSSTVMVFSKVSDTQYWSVIIRPTV